MKTTLHTLILYFQNCTLIIGFIMAYDIINLNEDLSYQKQAVISREIIRKNNSTVTLFAFDQGQGLSEHKAPFDALVHVVDGEVEISIDGEKHHLKAGELIIMPANIPHALQSITAFKMVLTMLRTPKEDKKD